MEDKRFVITKLDSPLYGLVGTVTSIYYDHQHTGDSDDMVYLTLDDGARCGCSAHHSH